LSGGSRAPKSRTARPPVLRGFSLGTFCVATWSLRLSATLRSCHGSLLARYLGCLSVQVRQRWTALNTPTLPRSLTPSYPTFILPYCFLPHLPVRRCGHWTKDRPRCGARRLLSEKAKSTGRCITLMLGAVMRAMFQRDLLASISVGTSFRSPERYPSLAQPHAGSLSTASTCPFEVWTRLNVDGVRALTIPWNEILKRNERHGSSPGCSCSGSIAPTRRSRANLTIWNLTCGKEEDLDSLIFNQVIDFFPTPASCQAQSAGAS